MSPASRVLRDLPAPTLPGVTSSISGRRVTGSPEASFPRPGPSSCSQPTRQYNDHCQSTASLPSGRGISPPGSNISRGGKPRSHRTYKLSLRRGQEDFERVNTCCREAHVMQHTCIPSAARMQQNIHASSAACIRADVLLHSRA